MESGEQRISTGFNGRSVSMYARYARSHVYPVLPLELCPHIPELHRENTINHVHIRLNEDITLTCASLQ